MAHEAHSHEHGGGEMSWRLIVISAVFLVIGLHLDNVETFRFINPYLVLLIYIVAFMPVGLPVMCEALNSFCTNAVR